MRKFYLSVDVLFFGSVNFFFNLLRDVDCRMCRVPTDFHEYMFNVLSFKLLNFSQKFFLNAFEGIRIVLNYSLEINLLKVTPLYNTGII